LPQKRILFVAKPRLSHEQRGRLKGGCSQDWLPHAMLASHTMAIRRPNALNGGGSNMIDRRKFLAAASAGVSAAHAAPKLALAGGTPVRAKALKAGFWGPQYYGEEEQQQLKDVLTTRRPFRWYGPGADPPLKVATFEQEFAARIGTRYALAVTSGTAALQCAMAALQIGPGDEVILPAWTWHSCYNAVVLAGALPVFAEIDESFNIDPSDIEGRITPQTKAILVAHLQG